MIIDDKIKSLRIMDIDDIIIGCLILEGKNRKEILKSLSVTSPAITHRLSKLDDIFGNLHHKDKNGVRTTLNENGIFVLNKFKKALHVLI